MDLTHKLLELVRIPSVTGAEGPLCEFLLQRVGGSRDYALTRVGHSFAMRPTRRSRKLVCFVGHLDTVPPVAENLPRIEGDRLYGLGASDMKSGVALMWHLLDQPVADGAYDLAFVFYDGEEGPYDQSGLGPLLAALDWRKEIDLGICLEPSDNVLQLGCMGTLHARVRFAGRAAHSARPWQGDNAIHKAGALLVELAAREPHDVRCAGLLYREVLSATLAQGGSATNVVPDRFELNLNYRFAPDRSVDAARQVVLDVVGGRAEVAFVDVSPAGPIPEGNQVLDALRQRCRLAVAPKQAWTDVARLAEAGVPAVNWGPGDNAQAHQPQEFTSVSKLLEGDRLLRCFLADVDA